MGLEAVTHETGSGHYERPRGEEVTHQGKEKSIPETGTPEALIHEERKSWPSLITSFANMGSNAWQRLTTGLRPKKNEQNGKRKHPEVHPKFLETADGEELERLEELVPSNLPEGFYTPEELSSALGALQRIIDQKDEDISELNVVTARPAVKKRLDEIFVEASGKLANYPFLDGESIQIGECPYGLLISVYSPSTGENSYLQVFNVGEYDEALVQMRNGYLLNDPLNLINCFGGDAKEWVKSGSLQQKRFKRVEEMVATLAQRLRQDLDRASYEAIHGPIISDQSHLEKEFHENINTSEAVNRDPNIRAIFAEQISFSEQNESLSDAMEKHATRQKERIQDYLASGNEKLKQASKNPLLEKLAKAKTPWEVFLDKGYKALTFGPSMLDVLSPKTMIRGMIEEYCIEHATLTPEELRKKLEQLSLRDLLEKKGLFGLLSEEKLTNPMKQEEKSLLDEYNKMLRLPKDGVGYALSEALLWKKMDISGLTAEGLSSARQSFADRSSKNEKPKVEDYLNLLQDQVIKGLAKTSGTLITDWSQFVGALLEDPALSELFTSPGAQADLPRKNIETLCKAYLQVYENSSNPRELALQAFMVSTLQTLVDDKIPEEEKKMRISLAQGFAKRLLEKEDAHEASLNTANLRAWRARTKVLDQSVMQYLNREDEKKEEAKEELLEVYLDQTRNISTSMSRVLLLGDDRFNGKLANTVTFDDDQPGVMEQLRMIEKRHGLILPVQNNGAWTFIYPYKMASWAG